MLVLKTASCANPNMFLHAPKLADTRNVCSFSEDDQEMMCLQLYQELQKNLEVDAFQTGKVWPALHQGKKPFYLAK